MLDILLQGKSVPWLVSDTGEALTAPKNYTTRFDEVDSSVSYIGRASIGASEAEAVWQVRKMVTSGADVTILWADGDDAFDNVWADRASLAYS